MPPGPSPSAGRRGVTLLELVVVMTIVGVALAVVAPRMRQSERSKVDLAAMQLVQDLDLARTRALSTRSMVRVAFTMSPATYAGYLDTNRDGVIAKTAVERDALRGGGTRTLPDGVVFGRGAAPALRAGDGSLPPDNQLTFSVRGLAELAAASAQVYLRSASDDGEVSAVVVLPSGLLRLRRYHEGVWE